MDMHSTNKYMYINLDNWCIQMVSVVNFVNMYDVLVLYSRWMTAFCSKTLLFMQVHVHYRTLSVCFVSFHVQLYWSGQFRLTKLYQMSPIYVCHCIHVRKVKCSVSLIVIVVVVQANEGRKNICHWSAPKRCNWAFTVLKFGQVGMTLQPFVISDLISQNSRTMGYKLVYVKYLYGKQWNCYMYLQYMYL